MTLQRFNKNFQYNTPQSFFPSPCTSYDPSIGLAWYVTLLVYRKSHISTKFVPRGTGLGFEPKMVNFISVTPDTITTYRKCVNRDELDYTSQWLSRGATLLDDGSIDISTASPLLTSSQLTHGLMSKRANGRIGRCISWMLQISKPKKHFNEDTKSWFWWRCNFITLSLSASQAHSDNIIKSKLLNHFLVHIARKYKVDNYIWRAEAQSNGRIHFHIITDKFIHWQDLQRDWNRIQAKLGYISRFYESSGHMMPNSTDVHSLKNVKNIAAYLTKYCSKNSKGITILLTDKRPLKRTNPPLIDATVFPEPNAKFYRQIHGKLWGCSSMLSRLCKFSLPMSDSILYEISAARPFLSRASLKYDYAEVNFIKLNDLSKLGMVATLEAIRSEFIAKKNRPARQLK